jgi:DNA-binding IclR family transcriptional regulator
MKKITEQLIETRPSRGIQSVEVGGQLLKALVLKGQRMALKDLAKVAGMTPAKAHPYLVSFGKLGLIEQDPVSGHYGLGALAIQLGLISLQQVDPVRLAIAALPELAQKMGLTVSAAVWGSTSPIIIRVEQSPTPVHIAMKHGTPASIKHTGTGKVFAAFGDPKLVSIALINEGLTGETKDAVFAKELKLIRQHGIAYVQDELMIGISAMAVPVFDAFGHLALGIAAIGPTALINVDRNSPQSKTLIQCGQALSQQLGAT